MKYIHVHCQFQNGVQHHSINNIIQQKYQKPVVEIEDLVTEALSVVHSSSGKPVSLIVNEAVQGHISLQNIQQLDFIENVSEK